MDLMRQLNPDDLPFSEAKRRTFSQILQSGHLQLIVAEINGAPVGSCYLNLIGGLAWFEKRVFSDRVRSAGSRCIRF